MFIHQRQRGRHAARRGLVAGAACLLLAATAGASTAAATEKVYGGEFYWGCNYSWGTACIEPHYHPKLENLLTMSADEASYLYRGVQTQNRYGEAKRDGASRCVAGAGWNGRQVSPWIAGEELVVAAGGGGGGYGMIGTCAPYYRVSLYQTADWGGEN